LPIQGDQSSSPNCGDACADTASLGAINTPEMTTTISRARLALHTYESLAARSFAMLAAARRRDWQALLRLERECAALVAQLQTFQGISDLDAPGKRRRAELMRSVLAHDAAVRELTQPWAYRIPGFAPVNGLNRRNADVFP
jgi:flagellar protein FliT